MDMQKNEGTLPPDPMAVGNAGPNPAGTSSDLEADNDAEESAREAKPGNPQKRVANNTRRLRMELMMSKAELARRAGVSILTIDRVERGLNCRMDTKRKIIEALGLKPSDRALVFTEDEE